ncbi:hypothetical protein OC845_002634 [Tilletia horrida]|nr:hypothetical protein OC845_002634 [Tilletia horrida]
MRTRRAAGVPEAVVSTRSGGLTTRSTTNAKKRKAPVANNATASAASESPARPNRSRSASTRTPLANKNAHSSSTNTAFSGSDLIRPASALAELALGSGQGADDNDDLGLSKQKTTNPAINTTKTTAASTTRPSLSQLVDEALLPPDEPAAAEQLSRASRKPTSSSASHTRGSNRQPSTTSTSTRTSSSTKSTSVASLLSNRKAARKQTVAPGGFYGQVQRAPVVSHRAAPAIATASSQTKASVATSKAALGLEAAETAYSDENDLNGSDEDEEVQTLLKAAPRETSRPQPAAVKPVTKSSVTSSKRPVASAAKNYAFKRTGNSQATTSASQASQNATSRPKRGLVVWDDEDDKASDEEDEDDVEMKIVEDARDYKQDKLKSPSEHSSSDKENRDPHASQTVGQVPPIDPHRTIGAAPPSKLARTPPAASRTQQNEADLIRSGQTSVKGTANRTPFAVLLDVGPSHSTPLSSGPRIGRSGTSSASPSKQVSKKDKGKQRAIMPEVQSLRKHKESGHGLAFKTSATASRLGRSKFLPSPSTYTDSPLIAPAPDLSSSIPPSDDVFLYMPPATSALPAFTGFVEDSLPMLGPDENEAGIGVNLELEDDLEQLDSEGDGQEPEQEVSSEEDFIRWPEQENMKASRTTGRADMDEDVEMIDALPRADTVGEKSFDSLAEDLFPGTGAAGASTAATRIRSVADTSLSFDQENDPYGFFAAEAKLRARREKEKELRTQPGLDTLDELLDGGLSNDAAAGKNENEIGRTQAYGLDLKTDRMPFASPSPVQSEDEDEAPVDGVGKGKQSSSQTKSRTVTKASTPAEASRDESFSPVRRSTRVRQRKESVIEVSDSESSSEAEKEVVAKKGRTKKSKGTAREEVDDDDSEAYDTDLPPPGFTWSTVTSSRRQAGFARPTANEPFDSEDEGRGRSSSGSSAAKETAKKRATSKKGQEKELRLSDLVKMLPRRSKHTTTATYGSRSKGKGRSASATKTAAVSVGLSDSSDDDDDRQQRESSVESLSELPDTKALTARERARPKARRQAPVESDEEENNEQFSEDSGEDEESATGRSKRGTGGRRVVSTSPTRSSKGTKKGEAQGKKAAKSSITSKSKTAASKSKQATASTAAPTRRSHRKEAASRSSDSITNSNVSSSRKRSREETEDEEEASASSSQRGAKRSKQVASTKKGKGSASTLRNRTKLEQRPRDELDDFELDTELVI